MSIYNLQYINEFFFRPKGPTKYIVLFESSRYTQYKSKIYEKAEYFGDTEKEALCLYLKKKYDAKISGNKVSVVAKHRHILDKNDIEVEICKAIVDGGGPIDYKIGNTNVYFDRAVDKGTIANLCKEYNLQINVIGASNKELSEENALRKAELKKVIVCAKNVVKSIESKFGKNMDFNIPIYTNKDDVDEFYNSTEDSVIISRGGLYDADSDTEGRKFVEDSNFSRRNRIFNDFMRTVNSELKKDKSIRGKITDDWDHYDFIISYDL